MKKALVFLVSFMISTMVVYSVYYYSNVGKLRRGLVATAEELPNTVVGQNLTIESGWNYIYTAGLMQASGTVDSGAMVPSASLLVYKGEINRDVENELNEELSQKFPKHPPLGFPEIRKGEQILFSYFFKNLKMPSSFRLADNGIEMQGKIVRALAYEGGDSAVFLRNGEKALLQVDISDDYILYYLYGFTNNELPDTAITGFSQIDFDENQVVLVPELDFFIAKKYSPKELKMGVSGYKLVEERVKFKTSVNEEKVALIGTDPLFTFGQGTQVLVKRKADSEPYFKVVINHPEILLADERRKK